MFRNVLHETAATRAHAAIINILEVERTLLRHEQTNAHSRERYRLFSIAHRAFVASWNKLMPQTDPLGYASAWDAHAGSSRAFWRLAKEVERCMVQILNDVAEGLHWFRSVSFSHVQASEEALQDILDSQRSLVLTS